MWRIAASWWQLIPWHGGFVDAVIGFFGASGLIALPTWVLGQASPGVTLETVLPLVDKYGTSTVLLFLLLAGICVVLRLFLVVFRTQHREDRVMLVEQAKAMAQLQQNYVNLSNQYAALVAKCQVCALKKVASDGAGEPQ